MNPKKKKYTQQEAYLKIRHYCAYQERCHKEVKEKLYSWGLWKTEVENITVQLIEDNFLNEERFAKVFSGSKFRIKKWGKKKILQKLREKNISDYCIKKGLEEISAKDYQATIQFLIEKKYASYPKTTQFDLKAKIAQYLYNKGFENELIWVELSHYFTSKVYD